MANSITATQLIKQVKALGSPEVAAHAQGFFKTGPGQYGEGDVFVGVRVPVLRKLAKESRGLPLDEIPKLLESKLHEVRLLGLLIMVYQFERGDEATHRSLYELYCRHLRCINNWDLVDTSAPQIVGKYLLKRNRKPLYQWAKSAVLWERRVAILATLAFIRVGDHEDTLALAEQLLHDPHDLMHKAVGWMLREVAQRDQSVIESFLEKHAQEMPRTMLRYTIEKFSPEQRQYYMRKT